MMTDESITDNVHTDYIFRQSTNNMPKIAKAT